MYELLLSEHLIIRMLRDPLERLSYAMAFIITAR